MDKKDSYYKIYTSSFDDPSRWSDWFVHQVCSDEDILLGYGLDGSPVSGLAMRRYDFSPLRPGCEHSLNAGYLAGVATLPRARGKGEMSALMTDTLHTARLRKIDVCTLIPASRRLYFFYDKFGFSTVFYRCEERYTSVHDFSPLPGWETVAPDFESFEELEKHRHYSIRHSRKDFSEILADARMCRTHALAVRTADGSRGMIFAKTESDGTVFVHCLMSDNNDAAEAALQALRKEVGAQPFVVMRDPEGARRAQLRAYGMIRIVNAGEVLAGVAAAMPELKQAIRVYDPILRENCGTYILDKGLACKEPYRYTGTRLSLDVNIEVLARILFNTPSAGEIFGLPTMRPFMSLMLD